MRVNSTGSGDSGDERDEKIAVTDVEIWPDTRTAVETFTRVRRGAQQCVDWCIGHTTRPYDGRRRSARIVWLLGAPLRLPTAAWHYCTTATAVHVARNTVLMTKIKSEFSENPTNPVRRMQNSKIRISDFKIWNSDLQILHSRISVSAVWA